MQSYPLTLSSANPSQVVGATGDLFVYESGVIVSRTNLLTGSETLTTGWAGCSVTATTSNYKGSTYQRIQKKTTAANEAISQAVAQVAAGGSLTLKFAMRADSSSLASVGLYDGAGWGTNANATAQVISGPGQITQANGGLFSISGLSATVDTVFVITRTYTAAATPSVMVYPGGSASVASTDAVQATRFMLETGAVYGPYIATNTQPVTLAQGDSRVRIKSENGAEVILKPGQRVRMTDEAQRWYIALYDNETPQTVNAIIGSGEFEDSNTNNVVTLNGTFTNTVQVNNTAAQAVPVAVQNTTAAPLPVAVQNTTANRLPVALDTTATQQVSIVGTVTVAGSTVNYTNAWSDNSQPPSNQFTVLTVVAPASNTKGMFVELAEFSGYAGGNAPVAGSLSLIAKASAPTSETDGDVLMVTTSSSAHVNDRLPYRISIAAGKGLYVTIGSSTSVWNTCKKTVLTTIS